MTRLLHTKEGHEDRIEEPYVREYLVSSERPGPQNANQSSSESADQQANFEQDYYGYIDDQHSLLGEDEPDVVLDVPVLKVDEINLEVEDLKAHVSLRAELADLVKVNVGVDAYLGKVKLEIKGVEAQALLKVRLERMLSTIDRGLDTIDRNPQILGRAFRRTDEAGQSAEQSAQLPAGDTANQAGRAAKPANDASGGAQDETEQVVVNEKVAGNPADHQIEEEHIDEQGRIVRRAVDELGNVVEETLDEKGNVPDPSAKEAEGRESEEDKDDVKATDAARRKARELGVRLSDLKGTGSGGRILVRDVRKSAQ